MAKNGAGFWLPPFVAWWAKNTSVKDPGISHFWATTLDDTGNPVNSYFPLLQWKSLTSEQP